jgi:ABC-type nitrate/sulfonate/bicarbonate transport system substrate-binding protein
MTTERMAPRGTLDVSTFGSMAVEFVAFGGGFLQRAGLDVTVHHATSSKEQMEGLRQGRYPIIHTSPDNVLHERVSGLSDAFVFMVLDTGLPQTFLARAPHREWGDLKGGVLGVDAADSGYAFVAYEMLRQQGLVRDVDYEVVAVGSSRQRFEALLDGKIDACLLGTHVAAEAIHRGSRAFARASDLTPWYPGITAVTTRGFADRNPDVVRAYATALTTATRWMAEPANSEGVLELVALALEVSAERAREVVSMETASRTALLPSTDQAASSLASVAALRSAATGIEVTGYFDDAWMRRLEQEEPAGAGAGSGVDEA